MLKHRIYQLNGLLGILMVLSLSLNSHGAAVAPAPTRATDDILTAVVTNWQRRIGRLPAPQPLFLVVPVDIHLLRVGTPIATTQTVPTGTLVRPRGHDTALIQTGLLTALPPAHGSLAEPRNVAALLTRMDQLIAARRALTDATRPDLLTAALQAEEQRQQRRAERRAIRAAARADQPWWASCLPRQRHRPTRVAARPRDLFADSDTDSDSDRD